MPDFQNHRPQKRRYADCLVNYLKFDLKTKEKITLSALFFQFPTMEAALNGIEDVHNFAASIEGKKFSQLNGKTVLPPTTN